MVHRRGRRHPADHLVLIGPQPIPVHGQAGPGAGLVPADGELGRCFGLVARRAQAVGGGVPAQDSPPPGVEMRRVAPQSAPVLGNLRNLARPSSGPTTTR